MGRAVALFLLLLLPALLSALAAAAGEGNAEVRALMELKDALDPEGRVLSSWTAEGEPCGRGGFEGVGCNELGKVANISLQGKGLVGYISPAVAGLRFLSGLFLHYNSLTGEIPPEISKLTELSDLYLNVNNLSGGIPPEIGNMASLQGESLAEAPGPHRTLSFFFKKLSLLEKLQIRSFLLPKLCVLVFLAVLQLLFLK